MQKHTGILENLVLFFFFLICISITTYISKSAFEIFLKMNLFAKIHPCSSKLQENTSGSCHDELF